MTAVARSIVRSRLLGSLYGMAVGDALGGPHEFKSRGSYEWKMEMEESHTFYHDGKPLPPGSWTDDTSMALCLGASLLDKKGLVWTDAAERFARWMTDGYMSVVDECFDIGMATRTAVGGYLSMKAHSDPFPDEPSFNPHPNSGGNGSIMRLAPLPAFYWNSPAQELYDKAALSSRITHSSNSCVDACVLMSAMIVGFVTAPEGLSLQEKKNRIMSRTFDLEESPPEDPDDTGPSDSDTSIGLRLKSSQIRQIYVLETYKTKSVEDIRTSGFVVHTLEAALWALWRSETFEAGLELLLPLGEDVDTVCAVYGQLAGACFGLEAIPERWLNGLQRKEEMLDPVFVGLVDASAPADPPAEVAAEAS